MPMSLAAIGMKNCNLLVSIDTSGPIVTDSAGSFTTSVSLIGTTVYGQAWVPDPKSNYAGVAMTNGSKAVVGY